MTIGLLIFVLFVCLIYVMLQLCYIVHTQSVNFIPFILQFKYFVHILILHYFLSSSLLRLSFFISSSFWEDARSLLSTSASALSDVMPASRAHTIFNEACPRCAQYAFGPAWAAGRPVSIVLPCSLPRHGVSWYVLPQR